MLPDFFESLWSRQGRGRILTDAAARLSPPMRIILHRIAPDELRAFRQMRCSRTRVRSAIVALAGV